MATETSRSGAPGACQAVKAKQDSKQTVDVLFPFLDLRAQYATVRDEVHGAVDRVLESQHFILGAEVESLENEIAAYVGSRTAVGCASGTDALILSLLALGLTPGDEVITTPFTFVATAGSVARVGAKPVFVDIEPDTFNIDPALIRTAITPRTRALIPVHLFGLAADMAPILETAREHGLAVIEDAAQALGAVYQGTRVGRLGTLGCYSFFPSKNLGGAGDGGMITTDDPSLADRLRLLRAHGSRKKYYYDILGTNSRLDALQAAILRVKLRHLEEWARARQARAETYRNMFTRSRLKEIIKLPSCPVGRMHVYNQYVIRSPERDRLREHLRQRGIPTEVYYPLCLHLQPAFAYLGYGAGQFPQAERASREVAALPIYPELSAENQEAVVRSISEFYGVQESKTAEDRG